MEGGGSFLVGEGRTRDRNRSFIEVSARLDGGESYTQWISRKLMGYKDFHQKVLIRHREGGSLGNISVTPLDIMGAISSLEVYLVGIQMENSMCHQNKSYGSRKRARAGEDEYSRGNSSVQEKFIK